MLTLLVSRRLPDAVMAEAEARFSVTCRPVTTPMDHAECVAALREHDLILPTLGDAFRAPAFAEVPEPRAKLLANFGVGYNHIDVAAARAAQAQGARVIYSAAPFDLDAVRAVLPHVSILAMNAGEAECSIS